ncbi:MAG: cell wall hydrolase [Phocaeicola sp.]
MIKKAYLVAVLIVLSAIVTIVALGASGVEKSETDTTETTVVATTKDTNENPLELKETTEPETELTTEALTETTDVADKSTAETITPIVYTKPEKNYTDDDLFYLAAAVCREAGGESEEIQLLVANVVINRVNSSIYPDTIYGVLTDYRQYGMMWKYGVSFPDWADQKTIDHCYDVARRILEGERVCPDNVLFQAEFEQGSGVYKQFDGFYFCYYG